MIENVTPRFVTSTLVEATADAVTITWGLGDEIPRSADYFRYSVTYYGADEKAGAEFGVRFHETPRAYVFDLATSTQANYAADSIDLTDDRIVVRYRDASIGLTEVGTIFASVTVDGDDVQLNLPVTLLR